MYYDTSISNGLWSILRAPSRRSHSRPVANSSLTMFSTSGSVYFFTSVSFLPRLRDFDIWVYQRIRSLPYPQLLNIPPWPISLANVWTFYGILPCRDHAFISGEDKCLVGHLYELDSEFRTLRLKSLLMEHSRFLIVFHSRH